MLSGFISLSSMQPASNEQATDWLTSDSVSGVAN